MEDQKLDLIWGVGAIAKVIGRTERQTFHLLATGTLPGKKVGGRWVARHSELLRFFSGDDAGREGGK